MDNTEIAVQLQKAIMRGDGPKLRHLWYRCPLEIEHKKYNEETYGPHTWRCNLYFIRNNTLALLGFIVICTLMYGVDDYTLVIYTAIGLDLAFYIFATWLSNWMQEVTDYCISPPKCHDKNVRLTPKP